MPSLTRRRCFKWNCQRKFKMRTTRPLRMDQDTRGSSEWESKQKKTMAAFTSSGYFCCWFTSSREIKPISAMVPPAEVTLRSFLFFFLLPVAADLGLRTTVLCEKKRKKKHQLLSTLSFHVLLFLFVLRWLCFRSRWFDDVLVTSFCVLGLTTDGMNNYWSEMANSVIPVSRTR